MRSQRLYQNCGRVSLGELAEGFKDWVVGFLASEAFDGLTAGDSHTEDTSTDMLEGIDQTSLANSGFAADKNNLPPSLKSGAKISIKIRQC